MTRHTQYICRAFIHGSRVHAECSCDWMGPLVDTEDEATASFLAHLAVTTQAEP